MLLSVPPTRAWHRHSVRHLGRSLKLEQVVALVVRSPLKVVFLCSHPLIVVFGGDDRARRMVVAVAVRGRFRGELANGFRTVFRVSMFSEQWHQQDLRSFSPSSSSQGVRMCGVCHLIAYRRSMTILGLATNAKLFECFTETSIKSSIVFKVAYDHACWSFRSVPVTTPSWYFLLDLCCFHQGVSRGAVMSRSAP